MSSFTAMWLVFPFLLFRIRWSISNATVVLSVISLPGKKALWASKITLGKMDFIQLVRTLDIIRETTSDKLMGRN